ncbi:MAG: S8 family serine peptidase [Bacteroidales bacterium]|nr:S8 family serine peptidase [Bacteroidales bacterium]
MKALLIKILLILPGLLFALDLHPQTGADSYYFYRIYLKDKGGSDQYQFIPEDYLSPRSIERRIKNGVATDYPDLPLHKPYLDTLRQKGLYIHCTSKWMNSVVVTTQLPIDEPELTEISFIDSVMLVKPPVTGKGETLIKKFEKEYSANESPSFRHQLEIVKGDHLHDMGFEGDGILIAVIDAGFMYGNMVESLSHLFLNNRAGTTYDFVLQTDFVFDHSYHGTAVLSILAGDIPGHIKGSAPGADYILLRSEDAATEYPVEEDFWVAAAEFADSAGADILSTSLGYSLFDDPAFNHSYHQMNGETIFISKAAGIAYSRGMIVVNSAGNSRDEPWIYITAPADNENVLAVGSVDQYGKISGFSSAGPSYDRNIKPDITTMGVEVTYQKDPGSLHRGNGTSFSCPVASGLTACLMQAYPTATTPEIMNSIKIGADRYMYPDSLYGYGIANFYNSWVRLNEVIITNNNKIVIYPNPTTRNLFLRVNDIINDLEIRIYNLSGSLILSRVFYGENGPVVQIPEFSNLQPGIYILAVEGSGFTDRAIIIKTGE